jgi:cysteine synthase A
MTMNSAWVKHAISEINADYQRSADTHLIRLALPGSRVFRST